MIFDEMLDSIPEHSSHLLLPESNILHYLKAIRFKSTDKRAQSIFNVFNGTPSESVKRACIDCWRQWHDRPRFIMLRNQWNKLGPQAQRMLWLAAAEFGDDGENARNQVRKALPQIWRLEIERQNKAAFFQVYQD